MPDRNRAWIIDENRKAGDLLIVLARQAEIIIGYRERRLVAFFRGWFRFGNRRRDAWHRLSRLKNLRGAGSAYRLRYAHNLSGFLVNVLDHGRRGILRVIDMQRVIKDTRRRPTLRGALYDCLSSHFAIVSKPRPLSLFVGY